MMNFYYRLSNKHSESGIPTQNRCHIEILITAWLNSKSNVIFAHDNKLFFEKLAKDWSYILSDCKMPCTTTRTNTKIIANSNTPRAENTIIIVFTDTMQITKTQFVQFNLWSFLSDIGGSLGLWLGLGIVQLGEIILQGVSTVWEKIGCR